MLERLKKDLFDIHVRLYMVRIYWKELQRQGEESGITMTHDSFIQRLLSKRYY